MEYNRRDKYITKGSYILSVSMSQNFEDYMTTLLD